MKHLTTIEILHLVDGAIDSTEHEILEKHLAGCERCRQEVTLQRALINAGSRLPLVKTSTGFTSALMRLIVSGTKESFTMKILKNSGPALAMAIVLAIVGYAISLGPSPEESATKQILNQVTSVFTDGAKLLTIKSGEISKPIATSPETNRGELIGFILLSFTLLLVFDKILLKPRLRR